MYRPLAILILTAVTGLVAFGDTSPIPNTLLGVDYITFNGSSFPGNGSSLICFPAGCGGAFNATINSGATQQLGSGVSATVWCVDYQLDVTTSSSYTTDIDSINNIIIPVDDNVRYGNLNSVSPTGTSAGWTNSVVDPTGLDGNSTNSSSYRYALAAALVSEYTPSPQDVNGGSAVDTAIQEAVWYVTYNSDYAPGATWPPTGSGIPASGSCSGAGAVDSAAPTGAAASDFSCWVQYAEDNANTVNTSAWAVVSGPADASGNLLPPATVDGYPSYQTFLVQVATDTITTGSSGGPLPEPTYFALLGVSCLVLFVVSRRRRSKA
jgi:hypothetical protein